MGFGRLLTILAIKEDVMAEKKGLLCSPKQVKFGGTIIKAR